MDRWEDTPEGPACPVDPETDDAFSDVLVRVALAAEVEGVQVRRWRVWIRPASAPFCRWLLWNAAVWPGETGWREESGAVEWPMRVLDAEPVARELMIQMPELTAWAEPIGED